MTYFGLLFRHKHVLETPAPHWSIRCKSLPLHRPTTKQVAGWWKLALKGIQPVGAGWEDSLGRNNHRGLRRDPEGCDRISLRFRTTLNFSAAFLAVVSVERARGRKDTVCRVHWRSEKSERPKWSSPSFWWKTAPFSGSRKKWRGSPSSVPLHCPWSSSSTLVSVHSRMLHVALVFFQPPFPAAWKEFEQVTSFVCADSWL